jgi:hypothetical protein
MPDALENELMRIDEELENNNEFNFIKADMVTLKRKVI